MMAGIQDILIITTPFDSSSFSNLLGDGSQFGINIHYAEQPSPDGLAQAFIIGEEFIGQDQVSLILGDNIFYGKGIENILKEAQVSSEGATIFGYEVDDPSRYGVVELNIDGTILSLEEKPVDPKSNIAITGLYFYDNQVVEMARSIKPSKRNELEITDLHSLYNEQDLLNLQLLPSNFTWLDTGTYDSLLEASLFVKDLEKDLELHKQIKVGCLEEIAFKSGWISSEDLLRRAEFYKKTSYGIYLQGLIKQL